MQGVGRRSDTGERAPGNGDRAMQSSRLGDVSAVQQTGPVPTAAAEEQDLAAQERRGVWARLRREPVALACLIVIVLFVLAAACAPWLAPHKPTYQFVDGLTADGSPLGSSARFPLGTDSVGRDVLSRLLF